MKYIGVFVVTFAIVLISVGCNNQSPQVDDNIKKMDLSECSAEKPDKKLNLLFIHHSCGATLLADSGEKSGEYCLWTSHPNGGGLRKLLEKNNYNVHEATYGSKIGQNTDIHHWNKKFRDHMDTILKTDRQNDRYKDNSVNQIVVFKSCYPNNRIMADGSPLGDPDSPIRTLWNYKAAYKSLLSNFKQYPRTLFVAVTAPPIVEPKMNFIKSIYFSLIGKAPKQIGKRAREFNNWLKDMKSGWLSNYKLKNVVVFNYYDILTGNGTSNWSKYPTKNGTNSHPSAEGNSIAAREFIDFLNRAVRYSGMVN